ncbi:AlpA family phage regulatory protein [Aquincola sp. J276]|uniref:AlpA family phage regulatory protein n=1 Tax=Aquincola sp. J276 TaxID=2898432 RepID=UPI002873764E|nr:AlpA family phage regulatory protein [Aquincola sp. J276]
MNSTQPALKAPAPDASLTMFVRMAGVVRMTGLGRSTIYRLMAENKFPLPVRLAKRAVAWRRIDLEQWSAARPSTSH